MERSYLFEYPRPWQNWIRSHVGVPKHNLNEVFVNIVIDFIRKPKALPGEIFLRDYFIDTFEEIFLEDLDSETIEKEDQRYMADLLFAFDMIKDELYGRQGNFLHDAVETVVRHADQFFKPSGAIILIGDIQNKTFTLVEGTHPNIGLK